MAKIVTPRTYIHCCDACGSKGAPQESEYYPADWRRVSVHHPSYEPAVGRGDTLIYVCPPCAKRFEAAIDFVKRTISSLTRKDD